MFMVFFFFNDSTPSDCYTLSLHDALPICPRRIPRSSDRAIHAAPKWRAAGNGCRASASGDRKSTRLNSSHQIISYAVFCLKKKIGEVHGEVAHLVFQALVLEREAAHPVVE